MARFVDKVQFGDGCWEWQGAKLPEGYGMFRFDGRPTTAHRASYMLLVGDIPEGLVIDHLCRNHGCVHPDHLQPVTNRVNTMRGVGITAINAGLTECRRGHAFTPENTWTKPDGSGGRWCRACLRIRHKEYRQRLA